MITKTETLMTTTKIDMNLESINTIVESQLAVWDLAKRNYDNLVLTKRRPLTMGDFKAHGQLNPARVVSTGAAVDKKSIEKRPCFLCKANRPEEQIVFPWLKGWEFLVNPFPILPIHFTIPAVGHVPQDDIPLEMASMAEMAPDLVIFYNGARAGASAPDHLHCQAVLKCELPVISLVEEVHHTNKPGWHSSEEFDLDLPFHFLSAIITPDAEGMLALSKVCNATGLDGETGKPDKNLVNAFFWIDNAGLLRIIIIPRKAHRSSHYFSDTDNYMISPGALDMAGIIVMPREEDYNRITENVVREIYNETAYQKLPKEVKKPFDLT